MPTTPPRAGFSGYKYAGYNPTRNQSEEGTPQASLTGFLLRSVRVVGSWTVLPFHFMNYKNATGTVNVGTYIFVSPYWQNRGYQGQVPIKTQPAYTRPKPWLRKLGSNA